MSEPLDRERYDFRWQAYPWELRGFYWLRCSDAGRAICTRCDQHFEFVPAVADDTKVAAFTAWVELHKGCPLGVGLRGIRPAQADPLLAPGMFGTPEWDARETGEFGTVNGPAEPTQPDTPTSETMAAWLSKGQGIT